ncbi:MAG: META domain-containing protein [Chitinophagaceae bacterium]|nr:META domain-containing protein [Chitinophagaceae bacterium]
MTKRTKQTTAVISKTTWKIKFQPILFLIILSCFSFFQTALAAKKKNGRPAGAFQLVAQLDQGKMVVVGFKNSNILFNQETKQFNAYVGCNTISGSISGKRNELRLAQLVKTEKACPDYIDGLEEQFMQHLGNITAYRWEGNSLLLMNNNTVLMKLKHK